MADLAVKRGQNGSRGEAVLWASLQGLLRGSLRASQADPVTALKPGRGAGSWLSRIADFYSRPAAAR